MDLEDNILFITGRLAENNLKKVIELIENKNFKYEDIEKKFWEVYFKYDAQRLILSRDIALTNRKLLQNKIIEDFEIQELIQKTYENGSKSLELTKSMMTELSKIIDNGNLVTLRSVELKFRQLMISRARNNKKLLINFLEVQ